MARELMQSTSHLGEAVAVQCAVTLSKLLAQKCVFCPSINKLDLSRVRYHKAKIHKLMFKKTFTRFGSFSTEETLECLTHTAKSSTFMHSVIFQIFLSCSIAPKIWYYLNTA
jgi:hypothetical protein